ncbi:MAG: FIMAH domain-containing protein [Candidatus Hodarchaeales archaeon]
MNDGSINNAGIAEGLIASLDQAATMIENGNTQTARRLLKSFIRRVEAQSGKQISTDAAQVLIEAAQAMINSL